MEAFEHWTQSSSVDELSRIPALRGQKASRTRLTPPAGRRERIIEALSWCPAGVWIPVIDFFRASFIWQFNFDVEETPHSQLYLGSSREYGDLNYVSYSTYWRVVNGLYIHALLWEYLATIGALDIGYCTPEDSFYEADVPEFDALNFSLYDGLLLFRINDLGAYLFGQHAEYTPLTQKRRPFLRIGDDLVARVVQSDQATPSDLLLLRSFAAPVNETSFRLSLESLLTAAEQGQNLADALRDLKKWHDGPLPAALQDLFADAAARCDAFSRPVPALKIKARTRQLANLALEDPKLKRLCQLAGDNTLVIPANRERTFRNRLRELGYVLPQE